MEFLLTQILTKKISVESIKKWILNPKDATEEILRADCNVADFAFYFLSFLREQTASILPTKSSSESLDQDLLEVTANKRENVSQNKKSFERKYNNAKNFTPLPNKSPNQNSKQSLITESSDQFQNKNWKQNQTKTSPSNITLGNFIITTKTNQKHKRNKPQITGTENEIVKSYTNSDSGTQKRRINPTRVTLKSEEAFGSPINRIQQTTNPFASAEEVSPTEISNERNVLKQDCVRVQNNELNLIDNELPDISKLEISTSDVSSENKEQLDILSDIYSCILNNDLSLNIMTELYFLIELLTIENIVNKESDSILGSVQKCVYFSSFSLKKQKELLQYLDSTTIRFLIENQKLLEFTPDLIIYLKKIRISINRSISISSNNPNGVSYQSENTNDKQNFSTSTIFQSFRKHRDNFYSILEKWDIERYFTNVLVKNIESIFKQQCLEPEFYVHFSQLFVSQLLVSCVGEGCDKSSRLPDLQVDPQRLRLLQERLVTPTRTSGGPCPIPEFLGWEEFFRDFLVIAASPSLSQHVQDVLTAKILELNAQQFVASELQESDTKVEDETYSKFLTCALSAQLLGKFLGFLHFAAYRPSPLACKKLSEHAISLQAAARQEVTPPLDYLEVLTLASDQARLVLTLPWLCSYLAQLDPVSVRLRKVQATLALMLNILRGLGARKNVSEPARLLLRFTLGWGLGVLAENNSCIWEMARNSSPAAESVPTSACSLDRLELVDSRALLSLCPFLSELRGRLVGVGGRGGAPQAGPRHITPVTASSVGPAQQVELQLEASFLQTQPNCVRRTLEFVSERVATSCTKQLAAGFVVSERHKLIEEVADKVKETAATLPTLSFVQMVATVKDALLIWSREVSEAHCRRLHEACSLQTNDFCSSRCSTALNQLLPEVTTATASRVCMEIAARNASTKVNSWMYTNLSLGEIHKNVQDEIERAAKSLAKTDAPKHDPRYSNTLPPGGRDVKHNDDAPSPADTLVYLRELVLFVLSGGLTEQSHLVAALATAGASMSARADLIPSAQTFIQTLTVDLAMALACHQPDLLEDIAISHFIALWQGPVGRPCSLDRLLSSRNLHQVATSISPCRTWAVLRALLVQLIKTRLVSPSSLEQQAVSVLQQEWGQDFLHHYTKCIEELVRDVGRDIPPSDAATFSQLLQWLADFCSDLEDLP